ncbi:MBL fold metallo-hydrolase (plasmid) [Rhizobium leguminosarum]|uniref:MBL fold metallo-hydrolase n=1 Tax=Rhizobium leguminosarum TaxID=384 RepID=UPI001030C6D6|nr:MBL fold metallo-hydrolase [Rhizobium leguminosarum]TBF23421.1 MBL fold metallo-hydrolase [Rhizobium leguminosarum]TBG29515.1 MBL fold metallo-hydrolase [Rhizobium leguminosarum]
MANELLIRVYDVGLGDCIYVRIPAVSGDNNDAFHMLIDCGTWSSESLLETALKQLASELPAATGAGKKRLDLVVVTHEHKDHIAGFDPALWEKFAVSNVWMNCAMNPKHPEAGKTRKVRKVAEKAMASLTSLGSALSPRLSELVSVFEIGNAGAMNTLRHALLAGDREPTYVHAGQTHKDHGIELHPNATIHILAPEFDFDRFYLGKVAQTNLKGVIGADAFAAKDEADPDSKTDTDTASAAVPDPPPEPKNISQAAFRALRARMQSNAMAFADLDGKLKNNSSVVLLLEWKGKRLLFIGDAEWHGAFKEGKMNGSWNVMWKERNELLTQPVDFLKIGHHGSENATPWDMGSGTVTEEAKILEAILPLPKAGNKPTARAVVSTERGKYRTIPRGQLLKEIARRVDGATSYADDLRNYQPKDVADFLAYEREWLTELQPPRTDFERIRNNNGFIDVMFD